MGIDKVLLDAGNKKRENILFYLNVDELKALVKRVTNETYSEKIDFIKIPSESGFDEYEISDNEDKILIKATSGVAASSAFNYYLKEKCGYTVGPIFRIGELPKNPPKIGDTKVFKTPFHYRYIMNYCTFGYSYGFYDWEKWEKTLDWILLSGYNMVLNPIGQEAVWVKVLEGLGYSYKDAKSFVAGPSFMPWFLMMNLTEYQSDYPDWWFQERLKLAGKFNKRLLSFGATPLMPGYCGMVPDDFKERFPKAKIYPQGNWGGYKRPAYILPSEPMFNKVGELFYNAQREIEGAENMHYYSCDPFHEGGKSEGIDLGEYGEGVYNLMKKIDPKAVWCFQGWQENPERVILNRVGAENVLTMNLRGEDTFDGGDNFGETPWLYCGVNNFGGQHVLRGGIKNSINNPFKGLNGKHTMVGIGLIPEAVETDEIFFDILSFITYCQKAPSVEEYLKNFILRRYGVCNETLLNAWKTLADNVYNKDVPDGGDESPFCSRPSLTCDRASTWGGHSTIKEPKYLISVIEDLLKNYDECKASVGYQYDLVDFTRQLCANESWKAVYGLQKAFNNKDAETFKKLSTCFLERFDLLENMLKTQKAFLLGPRIEEARALGKTEYEKRWFEMNFRMLITVWAHKEGDLLHDYAAREYSGMVEDFYKPRWEAYISQLEIGLFTGKEPIEYERYDQEVRFSYERKKYPLEPTGDTLKTVTALFNHIKDNLNLY